MKEQEWEEERSQLLEELSRTEQIALESQAQAAIYLELLQNCNEAARQARDSGDITLLNSLKGNLMFYATPRDGEEWGRHFLHAYNRDAKWLEDTKKALEQIKDEVEKFLDNNETNPNFEELLKKIVVAAEDGLRDHLD